MTVINVMFPRFLCLNTPLIYKGLRYGYFESVRLSYLDMRSMLNSAAKLRPLSDQSFSDICLSYYSFIQVFIVHKF